MPSRCRTAKSSAAGTAIRDHLELHLYPGGRRGWCLTFKEPVLGKNGGVAGICGISRDLHAPGAEDGDFAAMSAAIDHIHRHFDEPLRLPALAEMAGLSVYQFDQRIRSLFHVTAGQYLVKVRIDAACKRLTGTDEPIAQIALDLRLLGPIGVFPAIQASRGHQPDGLSEKIHRD